MSLICKKLELEDLKELCTAPFDPVVIGSVSLSNLFVPDVTPLGPKPRVTEGFPFWFNQLFELADYIDPVLPRRYSNA